MPIYSPHLTRCVVFSQGITAAASALAFGVIAPAALAQLTPDATLGNENSVINNGAILGGELTDLIEGGASRGGNLFHSFEQFNIDAGQRVYFANPLGIENILSRVTGGDPSNILGTLGVDGPADLFFLNPNGILFGPGSALDVQGSLNLSTADAIQLGDDGWFSAADPTSDNLLEVNPSIFWFNDSTQPGATVVAGAVLAMPLGETLSIVSGEVSINGGQLIAPGGQINIASISEAGSVFWDSESKTLQIPVALERSDVFLNNGSIIRVTAFGGGNVEIYSDNVVVTNRSGIIAGNLPSPLAENTEGGDILIDADSLVLVDNFSQIGNVALNDANGGNIEVYAQDIAILNGSSLSTTGVDTGDVGDVTLSAENSIEISGRNPQGGNSSSIASSISGFIPGLGVFPGEGNSGNISLNARTIELADQASVFSSSLFASGIAGDISINANDLFVSGGALITSDTTGLGDAGNITVQAAGKVSITDNRLEQQTPSAITSQAAGGSTGDGGAININAHSLEISGGALSAVTFGLGNAGDITLSIRDDIRLDGINSNRVSPSGIFTSVEPGSGGNGGNIIVSTGSLEVTNIAEVSASTFGLGRAGNIALNIGETDLDIFSSSDKDYSFYESTIGQMLLTNDATVRTETFGPSSAGNIFISANRLQLQEGGQITSGSGRENVSGNFGSGGNITINTLEFIELNGAGFRNRSGIFSETASASPAGDISLATQRLSILNGAAVSSSSVGSGSLGGDGGNIFISAFESVDVIGQGSRRSAITTEANTLPEATKTANAGDLRIVTGNLRIRDGGAISSLALFSGESPNRGQANAGNLLIQVRNDVEVVGPDSFINSGILPNITGFGGDIDIQAQNLILRDTTQISAASEGFGPAGNIRISLEGKSGLRMLNSDISTRAERSSGGRISINTINGSILLAGDSDIRTDVLNGRGGGGNILLSSNFTIALDDSDILAFSADGIGGNIDLSQTTLFSQNLNLASGNLSRAELEALDGNDRVDINATGGIASGQISINDASFVENSLNELSGEIVDTATLTAGSCIARNDNAEGSFVVTGSEGLPQQPGGDSISAYPTGKVQTLGETTATSAVQEPQGVYQLTDGRLVLSHECLSR